MLPAVPRQTVLFGSSSSCMGVRQHVPFAEDDDVSMPVSPYAATNAPVSLLCYTYAHLYRLRVAWSALFYRVWSLSASRSRHPQIARLMAAGKPLPRLGDGTSQRDYTYVDDIVDGIRARLGMAPTRRYDRLGPMNF